MSSPVARALFLLLASVWSLCTASDWCYQSQVTCESPCHGPDSWHAVHEDCKKDRQSPINIVTRKTKLDNNLTPLKFNGYQHAFNSLLINNGHTVQGFVSHYATVSGGNLRATYKALQFHFHWGENGGPGSEHTIDGEQYPMEVRIVQKAMANHCTILAKKASMKISHPLAKMHIVHMREDFKSLAEALKDRTGVAVLGFFFEESKSANRKYDGLIQALKKVENINTNATLTSISLNNLITSEENMTKYYRYEGSLTTPACTEAVVWTVFEIPIPLNKAQLSEFSNLKFKDGKSMVKTFRPVMPRKGRTVYRSGSTEVMLSITLLLLCVSSALSLSNPY